MIQHFAVPPLACFELAKPVGDHVFNRWNTDPRSSLYNDNADPVKVGVTIEQSTGNKLNTNVEMLMIEAALKVACSVLAPKPMRAHSLGKNLWVTGEDIEIARHDIAGCVVFNCCAAHQDRPYTRASFVIVEDGCD